MNSTSTISEDLTSTSSRTTTLPFKSESSATAEAAKEVRSNIIARSFEKVGKSIGHGLYEIYAWAFPKSAAAAKTQVALQHACTQFDAVVEARGKVEEATARIRQTPPLSEGEVNLDNMELESGILPAHSTANDSTKSITIRSDILPEEKKLTLAKTSYTAAINELSKAIQAQHPSWNSTTCTAEAKSRVNDTKMNQARERAKAELDSSDDSDNKALKILSDVIKQIEPDIDEKTQLCTAHLELAFCYLEQPAFTKPSENKTNISNLLVMKEPLEAAEVINLFSSSSPHERTILKEVVINSKWETLAELKDNFRTRAYDVLYDNDNPNGDQEALELLSIRIKLNNPNISLVGLDEEAKDFLTSMKEMVRENKIHDQTTLSKASDHVAQGNFAEAEKILRGGVDLTGYHLSSEAQHSIVQRELNRLIRDNALSEAHAILQTSGQDAEAAQQKALAIFEKAIATTDPEMKEPERLEFANKILAQLIAETSPNQDIKPSVYLATNTSNEQARSIIAGAMERASRPQDPEKIAADYKQASEAKNNGTPIDYPPELFK